MSRLWPSLRTISLITAGAVAVHELRYIAGYGSSANEALAEQGHSYMSMIYAIVALLLLVAAARFSVSVVRASRGISPPARPPRFISTWAAFSGALGLVYTLQEGFEGSYSPGHPAGLPGIFGHGGWTALMFAFLLGAIIAVITRIAHQALELVARRAARHTRPRPRSAPRPIFRAIGVSGSDVLAWNLAGRAPPRVQTSL
jgi:hypothetical protein